MDTTDKVHPADAYGKRKPPYPTNPLSNVLKAVDDELSRTAVSKKEGFIISDTPLWPRADNRIEEIARLIVTLPFGQMLEMTKEISTTPTPDHSEAESLPPDIQLAMRINTWAQKKMEERNAFVRETPKTE